jgi:hypothetical protein
VNLARVPLSRPFHQSRDPGVPFWNGRGSFRMKTFTDKDGLSIFIEQIADGPFGFIMADPNTGASAKAEITDTGRIKVVSVEGPFDQRVFILTLLRMSRWFHRIKLWLFL